MCVTDCSLLRSAGLFPTCVNTLCAIIFWHWLHLSTNSFKTSLWTDFPDIIIQSSWVFIFFAIDFSKFVCIYLGFYAPSSCLFSLKSVFLNVEWEKWNMVQHLRSHYGNMWRLCRLLLETVAMKSQDLMKAQFKGGGAPRPSDAAEHKWYLCRLLTVHSSRKHISGTLGRKTA